MKKLGIILLVFFSTQAMAQVSFKAYVNETVVRESERFQITFEANDRWTNFSAPQFGPFRVVSGPNQSQSTSIVNGSMSTQFSYSYILQPTQVGTFAIPSARAEIKGSLMKTNPIEIKVVKDSDKPRDANDPQSIAARNNILRVFVSKQKVFVGEPIVVTFKLYYASQIRNYNGQPPNLNGFFKEEIQQKNQAEQRENYKGKLFNVATLKQYVLIPQKSGDLEIDPFVLDLETAVPTNQRDFFGRPVYETVNYAAKSNRIKIEVSALPEAGKPSDFSGAVGEYSFAVDLSQTEVSADESATLSIEVAGKGNLKLFELPKPEIPGSIEAYDPKYSERVRPTGEGLVGSRKNEYLLIPRFNGDYKIPAMTFSYFDVALKKYVQLDSEDYMLSVSGGADDPGGGASGSGTRNRGRAEVDYLNEEILFIKTDAGRWENKGASFRTSALRWVLYILGIALTGGFYLYQKNRAAQAQDQVGQRKKGARKVATKRLAEAKKLLNQGAHGPFYEEIARALEGYVRDKLQIDLAGLGLDQVLDKLREKRSTEDLNARVKKLWDATSFARYAPSEGGAADARHYEETLDLITELENALKR